MLVNRTAASLPPLRSDTPDEEVTAFDLDETKFGIYFFNELIDLWEPVQSTVDTIANEVTFVTDHFSIYAIGELPEDVIVPDDETGTSTATSTDAGPTEGESEEEPPEEGGLIERERGSGFSSATRVRQSNPEPLVLGISNTDEQIRQELMLQLIELIQETL